VENGRIRDSRDSSPKVSSQRTIESKKKDGYSCIIQVLGGEPEANRSMSHAEQKQ